MPRKILGILSILMALSFTPVLAQRVPERYEPVLIPFVGAIRAPTGIWYAQLWFRNDGDEPVDVYMQPRFVLQPEEQQLLTTTVQLRTNVDQTLPRCANPCDIPPLRFKPRYAEVFDLSGIAAAPEGAVLRIELEPEDPTLRYWAVVSASDNRTNAVKFFVLR